MNYKIERDLSSEQLFKVMTNYLLRYEGIVENSYVDTRLEGMVGTISINWVTYLNMLSINIENEVSTLFDVQLKTVPQVVGRVRAQVIIV